jgi:hypothetical protein
VAAKAQFARDLSVQSLELLNLRLHLGASFLLEFKCLLQVSNVGLSQLGRRLHPKIRTLISYINLLGSRFQHGLGNLIAGGVTFSVILGSLLVLSLLLLSKSLGSFPRDLFGFGRSFLQRIAESHPAASSAGAAVRHGSLVGALNESSSLGCLRATDAVSGVGIAARHDGDGAAVEAVDGHGLSIGFLVVNFLVETLADALAEGVGAGFARDDGGFALLVADPIVIFLGVEGFGLLVLLGALGSVGLAGVEHGAPGDVLVAVNIAE